MDEPTPSAPTWPENILPAIRRRAAEPTPATMIDLHPQILKGLRQLAADEPGGGPATRLLAACERLPTNDGGAMVPAGEVLDALYGAERDDG